MVSHVCMSLSISHVAGHTTYNTSLNRFRILLFQYLPTVLCLCPISFQSLFEMAPDAKLSAVVPICL